MHFQKVGMTPGYSVPLDGWQGLTRRQLVNSRAPEIAIYLTLSLQQCKPPTYAFLIHLMVLVLYEKRGYIAATKLVCRVCLVTILTYV